jgi:hypothetical protein
MAESMTKVLKINLGIGKVTASIKQIIYLHHGKIFNGVDIVHVDFM